MDPEFHAPPETFARNEQMIPPSFFPFLCIQFCYCYFLFFSFSHFSFLKRWECCTTLRKEKKVSRYYACAEWRRRPSPVMCVAKTFFLLAFQCFVSSGGREVTWITNEFCKRKTQLSNFFVCALSVLFFRPRSTIPMHTEREIGRGLYVIIVKCIHNFFTGERDAVDA